MREDGVAFLILGSGFALGAVAGLITTGLIGLFSPLGWWAWFVILLSGVGGLVIFRIMELD